MKSVLISIQPKWCELIASGKKTIEVRKTKPKLETPFKVYIYCTKPKNYYKISSCMAATDENLYLSNGKVKMSDGFEFWANGVEYERLNGKVIGEFECDKITDCRDINGQAFFTLSCMSLKEWMKYTEEHKGAVWAWHISNLVIYDKPRELSEFYTVDNEAIKQCEYRERVYNNPIYTNGAWLLGSYVCNKDETDWCKKCKTKPITRPPQSWCYVESEVEGE